MYLFDNESNSLVKVDKCSFKSLGLDERNNLQEWIAKEPSSLGEELLIIQKEFDGFSDTRERLDLLALDKRGNLVVIENKLDDSGRDVTWQAIKYASYCSSLTKQDIIDIYQKYLGATSSAEEALTEFFDGKDLTDIEINVGNTQRIFFVAANFRKEVTSSVMWLLNFNIRIKCFKVTPYKYHDKVLLDFDQIIPIKDADDYTIKIAAKNQTETQNAEASQIRYSNRQNFWADFIEYNKNNNGLFSGSAGTTDSWLGKSIKGFSGVNINICIYNSSTRSEIYINTGDKTKNKHIFDFLLSHKAEIEQMFREELVWQRLDDKVTCRIRIDRNDLSYLNSEHHEAIFAFFVDTTNRMMKAFTPFAKKYVKNV